MFEQIEKSLLDWLIDDSQLINWLTSLSFRQKAKQQFESIRVKVWAWRMKFSFLVFIPWKLSAAMIKQDT